MEKDSVIVPVSERTFNLAKENGIYIYPESLQPVKYIFFYQMAPISAIQYYAKVLGTVGLANKKIKQSDVWASLNNPETNAHAIKISNLMQLKKPIKKDPEKPPIQFRMYSNFKEITKAKILSNLFYKNRVGKKYELAADG